MPAVQFGLLTLAGSLIWNTVFVLAGYLLGEQWHLVEGYAGAFQKVVVVAAVALFSWWLFTRVRRLRRTPT